MTDPITGCCADPDLVWVRGSGTLPEPIVTCENCGFRLYPDGVLIDWLDPDAILMDKLIEERTPRILELAARLGLLDDTEGGSFDDEEH